MRLHRLPLLTLLLLPPALLGGAGVALSQSAAPAPTGSLPPPRPVQPATPPAAPSTTAPTAPAAAPRPQVTTPRPHATPPRPQATPPRPTTPSTATPRQAGQAPAAGRPPPTTNRRPAAAAGVAAGAAAGAAAATSRPPAPAQPQPPPIPAIGSVTGLALPRYAALRSDEVNMRVGPNTTFPIEWTFQRRDLPVMIVGEFQLWRRIRDPDGTEGWVHSSTLAGRRTVLIRPAAGAPDATLRRRPEEGGVTVAKLRTGVIARVRECEASSTWCELQVGGHRGFLRRAELWGIGAEEEIK